MKKLAFALLALFAVLPVAAQVGNPWRYTDIGWAVTGESLLRYSRQCSTINGWLAGRGISTFRNAANRVGDYRWNARSREHCSMRKLIAWRSMWRAQRITFRTSKREL